MLANQRRPWVQGTQPEMALGIPRSRGHRVGLVWPHVGEANSLARANAGWVWDDCAQGVVGDKTGLVASSEEDGRGRPKPSRAALLSGWSKTHQRRERHSPVCTST